ncbi:MAG: ArsR family transcriptional regulator [Thermoplasmata archaeon]|nr:ArsR family transcriptional regulator [Thermoplasmata archaeon]
MRKKFGITGLDKMLSGGLKEESTYLLIGPTGAGKTIVAARFLLEGLLNGENCLYIAVDKPPSIVLQNVILGFGWNLSRLRVMDAVPSEMLYSTAPSVRDITAKGEISAAHKVENRIERGELSVEGLVIKILNDVKEKKYDRVVLDSLTVFKRFAVDESTAMQGVHRLFTFFPSIGATALITASDEMNLKAETLLSSGVIKIEKILTSSGYERYIRILKMRGSDYDPKPKRMYITEDGIFVLR